MFKSLNRGISAPIAIIIIVACAVLTGLLAWQYGLIPGIGPSSSPHAPSDKTACDWRPTKNYYSTCETISETYLGTYYDGENCTILYGCGASGDKIPFSSLEKCRDECEEEEAADWKTYRNEKYGFEIEYPSSWVYIVNLQEEGGNEKEIFPSGGFVVAFRSPENIETPPSQIVMVYIYDFGTDLELEGFTSFCSFMITGESIEGFDPAEYEVEDTILAGEPAHQFTQVSKPSNAPLTKEEFIWTVKDNKGYALVVMGDEENFDSYKQTVFQRMEDSFKFTD